MDGRFDENRDAGSHLKGSLGAELSDFIVDAAEGCPVEVIKYDLIGSSTDSSEGVEGPETDVGTEISADAEISDVPPASPEGDSDAGMDFSMDGDRALLILFGSQSGNAEGVCAKMGKLASKYGLDATVKGMDEIQISDLEGQKRVLVVCSTWGEGDMPDNAEDLWKAANGVSIPNLSGTYFSVLALGDSDYEYFCQSGIDWDGWFEKQGALRLVPRVDCDVDYDSLADAWMLDALPHVGAVDGSGVFQIDAVEVLKFKASGGKTPTGVEVEAVGALQGFVIPEMSSASRLALFTIHRYDPKATSVGTDEIELEIAGHMTVYDALNQIRNWHDGSLAIPLGSNPVLEVNGRVVLANHVRIDSLVPEAGGSIRVDPAPGFPVIRDLISDLTSLRKAWAKSEPWFNAETGQSQSTESKARVSRQSPICARQQYEAGSSRSRALVHAASDTVPYAPNLLGPSIHAHMWAKFNDERLSRSQRERIVARLADPVEGVFAECDLHALRRHGGEAARASDANLKARRHILHLSKFSGRSGLHVKTFAKTVKGSGLLNETFLAARTLGPLGMLGNLKATMRMATGFTRTGGPLARDLQGYLAPGKLPKIINRRIDGHHEVVALYTELERRL